MNPPQHSPFTSIAGYMTRTVHFIHSYYTGCARGIYRKYRFSFETNQSVQRENHPTVRTVKTEKIKPLASSRRFLL